MRAIVIQHFGGLDSLVIKNLPDPIAQPGSVLIEVKAFGINHAENPYAQRRMGRSGNGERYRVRWVGKILPWRGVRGGNQWLRRGGRMCLAGWLGGLDPVNSFNPLLQMPSGVYFTFFGSFVFGTPDFPVSDVPLQDIVDKAAAGIYQAKPARVFQFDEIREAHEAMESNEANGKMVVRI